MSERKSQKMKSNIILAAKGITKSFNKVEVLHGVDFNLKRGEVHGIVGQNGAGKSTLMKIINGVYTRDKGTLLINNHEVNYDTPIGAGDHGISMVYQEFSLVPTMTVSENLFLGREPLHGPFINTEFALQKANQLFRELEMDIHPQELISRLPVGERQVVEIAKALSRDSSILIMDEPTASLSNVEIQSLFKVIRRLKKEGISIIFVSHHLNEVIEICDRVTVIRDGEVALKDEVAHLKLENIISAIIGKKYHRDIAERKLSIIRNQPVLEVIHLTLARHYRDVSFNLYPGEVLGIAGVLGCGRSELLKTIYGILPAEAGKIKLNRHEIKIIHPAQALSNGIIHVPEDRRKNGILGGLSVRSNILLPIWNRLSHYGFIQKKTGMDIVNKFITDLKIKTTGSDQLARRLSGGNQQKVVFAKSLATKPKILLLDDPTVGVDLVTKEDIAQIIRSLASHGNAIILVSSEMEELADLCDWILVMQKGRIKRIIDCFQEKDINEEYLMHVIQSNIEVDKELIAS